MTVGSLTNEEHFGTIYQKAFVQLHTYSICYSLILSVKNTDIVNKHLQHSICPTALHHIIHYMLM